MVPATGFDNQADNGAIERIKQAFLDQPVVDRRIEQLVVDHIVHVAVHVVVGPTRLEVSINPEIGAVRWR